MLRDIVERLDNFCHPLAEALDDQTRLDELIAAGFDAARTIERLRAALKPFADEAEFMVKNEDGWPEDRALIAGGKVTIGDYKRARDSHGQSASAVAGPELGE